MRTRQVHDSGRRHRLRRLAAPAERVSIQGLLEDALAPIEGSADTVHGAGRTDAGVHALGQVASATVVNTLDERDARPGAERGAAARRAGAGGRGEPRRVPRAVQRPREDLRVPHRERADRLGVPAPLRLARAAAARPRGDAHRGRSARRHPRLRRLPGRRLAGRQRPSGRFMRSTSRTAADSTCRSSSGSPATASSATWSGTSSGRWSRWASAAGTRGACSPSSSRATARRPAGRRRRRGCF